MRSQSALIAAVSVVSLGAAVASATTPVRFATYNASLNRTTSGELINHLSNPNTTGIFDPRLAGVTQAKQAAEVIQRVNPDVLLINEFDYDAGNQSLNFFQQNYLGISQNGATPVNYAYRYTAPSNTGIPTGLDLDNNGFVGGGNDAFGFGAFPGQFGMAFYSKYPILTDQVRTFQTFKWKDMPGSYLNTDPALQAFYSPAERDILRLSSKSHWDIPVLIDGEVVHILMSHPTPPVFDGAEDRNGKRNADEIRFWADYVTPGAGAYIYDDLGNFGGLGANARFVIMGDQNSDPFNGDSVPGAIQQLLNSPLVDTSVIPDSAGGVQASNLQGGINASHIGDPAYDTADFSDGNPGNLRVDYVLPSEFGMRPIDGGVYWPLTSDPNYNIINASDHRLVWVDAYVPEPSAAFGMGMGAAALLLRRRR